MTAVPESVLEAPPEVEADPVPPSVTSKRDEVQKTAPKEPPAPPPAPQRSRPVIAQPEEEPPEEGAPTWTVTFGDMMSLLLTFFILLFSMSEIEVEKFRDAVNSLHEGFGESVVDLGAPLPPPPVITDSADAQAAVSEVVEAKLDEIADALQQFVIENGLEQNVVVAQAEDGVHLQIRDVALFQPGGADIEASSAWIVEQLSAVLTGVNVPVNVVGHTDDVPIRNSRFQSNWELSAARAAGVARRLVTIGHDPDAIQVTAFGEYQPIDTNDTAEGRARNRRVELYYSRQAIEDSILDGTSQPNPDVSQPGETAAGGAGAGDASTVPSETGS